MSHFVVTFFFMEFIAVMNQVFILSIAICNSCKKINDSLLFQPFPERFIKAGAYPLSPAILIYIY